MCKVCGIRQSEVEMWVPWSANGEFLPVCLDCMIEGYLRGVYKAIPQINVLPDGCIYGEDCYRLNECIAGDCCPLNYRCGEVDYNALGKCIEYVECVCKGRKDV